MPQFWFATFLFLLTCSRVFPQSGADTTFLNVAVQNAVGLYHSELKSQAKLYNGSKYPSTYLGADEHPFFLSDDWIMGDVFYDGELFTDVPLIYDIVTSNLITEHFPSGHAIQLVKGKLKRFSIAGHSFEKIENESVGGSLPKTDFYDILYRGESKVIAQHQKITRVLIESLQVRTTFAGKIRYYIFKNGVFFHVHSKASVLKVLSDEKRSLKKFLKTNGIYFGMDRESALKRVAEFYDALKDS